MRQTDLHDKHRELEATFTDFADWRMPLKYGSERAEHQAVRTAAGIFDLSHMGQLWVRGEGAGALLDRVCVGKLSTLPVGKAKYSLLCTADGGIIDDVIVYRLEDEPLPQYLVVPNAANAAAVYEQLCSEHTAGAGESITVEDASTTTTLIALQGPKAAAVLTPHVAEAGMLDGLAYYAAHPAAVAGQHVLLARTGYTGEDGFEIYLFNSTPQTAIPLWETLSADPAVAACGLASRDSLRLEAGMPLYGHELTRERNPYEAGLGFAVALPPSTALKEGDFIGRSALERIAVARHEGQPQQRLVGLRLNGRRPARSGYTILKDGRTVGVVTSGAPSPTLGYPIAMGYVDDAVACEGAQLVVDVRGTEETATVVPLPFYRRQK